MRRIVTIPAGALLVLTACAEHDAAGFERAVDSFFISILEFFLMMMLLAAFVFVLWALIFAGAAAAVIAGIRRLTATRGSQAPRSPEQLPPGQGSSTRSSAPRDLDPIGVGMIIFGVVLLLAAAPTVLSVNLGPTSGGAITIPLPLILGGAGLVWYATRRRRDRGGGPEPAPRVEAEREPDR